MHPQLNVDRFIPLVDLNAYPGRDYLDRTIQLLWTPDPKRRIWLLTPSSSPSIQIEDVVLQPVSHQPERKPRWLDYGVVDLPFMAEAYPIWEGLVQVTLRGLPLAECAATYLLVTNRTEVSLHGQTIDKAQRLLWGLAQSDVGSSTLSPHRLTAGSPATFKLRYRAGDRGLPAGAHLRFFVPKAFSPPQTDRPGQPGYVSVTASEAEGQIIEIRNTLETHEKTSVVFRLDGPLAPHEGLTLSYRAERTFIYPAELDEVELRTWYSRLPPLTVSAAHSADHPFVSMLPQNGHSLRFSPGNAERLHLFLPGRRYDTEALSVRGTFTDCYRNLPPAGAIDANLELWLVKDREETRLGSLEGRFIARHRFAFPLPALTPGVYRVSARRPGENAAIATSNPLEIIPHGAGERLFWGEIHSHTELGDGSGDFEGVYRHAKEEGCLEFATVSEHAEYFTDNQWEWMQDVINAWNEPGRFVTLVGYEFIGLQKDRIVYTSRPRLELVRGTYHATRTLDKAWSRFHGDEQVVGGPHGTMVHKTKWEHHDPDVERFAEIYSMWGACDFREGPLVASWIEEGRGLTVNEILQRGARLGFTAGGDCHDGRVGFASEDPEGQGTTPHTFAAIILYRCGLTAANMTDLDRKDLIGALRNRRTYATTGDRILLDFSVSGLPMGSVGRASQAVCTATIHGVSALEEVQIIKDGNVVWRQPMEGLDVTVRWRDPEPPTQEHYYYLHLIQRDGQRAWSSPVWIGPVESEGTNEKS